MDLSLDDLLSGLEAAQQKKSKVRRCVASINLRTMFRLPAVSACPTAARRFG